VVFGAPVVVAAIGIANVITASSAASPSALRISGQPLLLTQGFVPL